MGKKKSKYCHCAEALDFEGQKKSQKTASAAASCKTAVGRIVILRSRLRPQTKIIAMCRSDRLRRGKRKTTRGRTPKEKLIFKTLKNHGASFISFHKHHTASHRHNIASHSITQHNISSYKHRITCFGSRAVQ